MLHVTILTNVTKCGNNFRINNTGIETKFLDDLYFVYKFFRGGNIMKKKVLALILTAAMVVGLAEALPMMLHLQQMEPQQKEPQQKPATIRLEMRQQKQLLLQERRSYPYR